MKPSHLITFIGLLVPMIAFIVLVTTEEKGFTSIVALESILKHWRYALGSVILSTFLTFRLHKGGYILGIGGLSEEE